MHRLSLYLVLVVTAAGCSDGVCDGLEVSTVSQINRFFPMPGIEVQLDGGPWQTTDEDGRTCFDGVTEAREALVYQRHTSPVSNRRFDDVWRLDVRGQSTLTIPVDNNYRPECALEVALEGGVGSAWVTTTSGGFQADGEVGELLVEPVDPTVVHAIEVETGESGDELFRYGVGSAEIRDVEATTSTGETAPCSGGVRIEVAPVESRVVTATVELPEVFADTVLTAYTLVDFDGEVQRPDLSGESVPFATTLESDGSVRAVYPAIDDAEILLLVRTEPQNPLEDRLLPALAEVFTRVSSERPLEVTLPAPVEVVEPAAFATTSDPNVVFRWNQASNVDRYLLMATCASYLPGQYENPRNDALSFFVYTLETTDTQATLPTIPSLDLPDGSEVECDWSVDSVREDGVTRDRSSTAWRRLTLRGGLPR